MIVEETGCQWSKVSKKFNGKRTEHMVKNRYKALMRKDRMAVHKELSPVKIEEGVDVLIEEISQIPEISV